MLTRIDAISATESSWQPVASLSQTQSVLLDRSKREYRAPTSQRWGFVLKRRDDVWSAHSCPFQSTNPCDLHWLEARLSISVVMERKAWVPKRNTIDVRIGSNDGWYIRGCQSGVLPADSCTKAAAQI